MHAGKKKKKIKKEVDQDCTSIPGIIIFLNDY